MIAGREGQAILEFMLVLVLVGTITVCVGSLLCDQWRQTGCRHLVFESVWAKLTDGPAPSSVFHVHYDETETRITGTATCGKISESATLPKLDHARW
jgi:hypothetical protein